MNLRLFLILQLLMLSVMLLVSPLLDGSNEILATIILDFAVFYLSGMFVGYLVEIAPVANALAVNIVFNALYYGVVFLLGWGYVITFGEFGIDALATCVFTIVGTWVGARSRQASKDQDVLG